MTKTHFFILFLIFISCSQKNIINQGDGNIKWNLNNMPIVVNFPISYQVKFGQDIENASLQWNEALGFNALIVQYYSTTIPVYQTVKGGIDGANVVSEQNEWNLISENPNSLAVTLALSYASRIREADIVFNLDYEFYASNETPVYSNQFHFKTVLLHEFGHLLGLDHTDELDYPDSVMNPFLSYDERRNLSSKDVNLIRKKYKR